MDIGNAEFFADLRNLGLENLEDEATKEQREETQRRAVETNVDSFNVVTEDVDGSPRSEEERVEEDPREPQHFSLDDYRTQAEGYVDILDLGNTMVLPNLYKKKLLTAAERSRIQIIKRTTEAGQYSTMSYEDQVLDKRLAEIQDLIDAIPFTPEEKKKLTEALAKVLQYYGMTANPTTVLVLTLIAVEGARLLPFVMMRRG